MPIKSEIIEIYMQDILYKLSRIKILNIQLVARLYNTLFKYVYNYIKSIKSKIQRLSTNKMLN
jgi:hypothetical protein